MDPDPGEAQKHIVPTDPDPQHCCLVHTVHIDILCCSSYAWLSVEQVTEVLSEVNMLKDRQEDTDSKLETMKMENEALWQEVMLYYFEGV
jgi:hypothetical protein